jgi:8-oxo-dGTP pyrophosphatase MutT (NUDIX family)
MNLENQNLLVIPEQFGLIVIVTVYLFCNEKFLIFKRDDNKIGPVSGKIEIGESYIGAAVRETKEETSLILSPYQVHDSGHVFLAISPKGKIVFGKTLYATLCSKTFEPSQIRLNSELYDYEILPFEKAIRKISIYGHPESADGIQCVLNRLSNKNERSPFINVKNLSDGSYIDLSRPLPWRN